MPGILPMKVIRVGANAQSRIAQACDRCRSKKIRCDGVRPCCSQCAHVEFECKTSDKLSRRAFPRGYTESLEETVRVLQAENKVLKELVDKREEQINLLSRIHSPQSSQSIQLASRRRGSTTSQESNNAKVEASSSEDDTVRVQQPRCLQDDNRSDSIFSGTSSTRTMVEAFMHRAQQSGRSMSDTDAKLLLASSVRASPDAPLTPSTTHGRYKAPPRLESDQLISIFFQEWAPLFPVLHLPTFITIYQKYVADDESVTDKADIAQINLVFGIATLSNGARSSVDLESFEMQWKAALDAILTENTMATLQSLILAQIFCVTRGDLTRLVTYKGLAISLSIYLGLPQSQKNVQLGTLTCETRKRVFWTLYTVDNFTAVTLGLPRLLKDDDIQCEYPVDVDDEYITERGFQPAPPGESTKLSSALALFRASRILSKVLEEVFPAKAPYDLSLKKLGDLANELDSWHRSLAPHLRLEFAQDKLSAGTVTSPSPLLSFTYHYMRALLQRPALYAGLGARESPYLIIMASACKHMIQIVELLRERSLGFSFCLNVDEVLVVSGLGLLFQGLGLDSNSKMLKDNAKMLKTVTGILKDSAAPCATDFERVIGPFIPERQQSSPERTTIIKIQPPSPSEHKSERTTVIKSPPATTKKHKALASRFPVMRAFKPKLNGEANRRATVHGYTLHPHSPHTHSVPSLQPSPTSTESSLASEMARSPIDLSGRPRIAYSNTNYIPQPREKIRAIHPPLINLDYLSFGPESQSPDPYGFMPHPALVRPAPRRPDWDQYQHTLDTGQPPLYDNASYSHQPILPGSNDYSEACTSVMDESAVPGDVRAPEFPREGVQQPMLAGGTTTKSVRSFSTEEGGSGGEDFTGVWASATSSYGGSERHSGLMTTFEDGEEFVEMVEGWDFPFA